MHAHTDLDNLGIVLVEEELEVTREVVNVCEEGPHVHPRVSVGCRERLPEHHTRRRRLDGGVERRGGEG